MLTELARIVGEVENGNQSPVLVCAPQLRAAVRRMVQPAFDRLPVLSYREVSGNVAIRSVGVVTSRTADGGGRVTRRRVVLDRPRTRGEVGMLSPISGVVLLIAAVLASPALWGAFVEGSIPVDAALLRYLIVVGITWACLSVISTFAWAPRKPALVQETKPNSGKDPRRTERKADSHEAA